MLTRFSRKLKIAVRRKYIDVLALLIITVIYCVTYKEGVRRWSGKILAAFYLIFCSQSGDMLWHVVSFEDGLLHILFKQSRLSCFLQKEMVITDQD